MHLKTIYVPYLDADGNDKTIAVRAFSEADAIARLEDFAAGIDIVIAEPEDEADEAEPEENDPEA